METFTSPSAMRTWAESERSAGNRIAVVPTMGALHAGHLALIEAGKERADRVVVTIFVNPLQFNEPSDFDAYPRPIDGDVEACRQAGVAAVYAPTAATMYPPLFQTHVEPGALAERLEGPMRPGHFRGVVTVVTKLFGATLPHVAMFGQKDYQQLAIVRQMAADLDGGVEIVGVPTVREPDGLALSSRNLLLTPEDRAAAVVVNRALRAAVERHHDGEADAGALTGLARSILDAEPRANVEYVELVDAVTLVPVDAVRSAAVILTAAWFGEVRLIDNQLLG
ncbi:MAG: pantoate--beta-alanine ligase [Ilumatobacter sp.]|uniref:pantoate--beta-alanine ligase n=1 Tax=Ilumatobacter sp. TaxID=1967498 RepID=UPI002606EDF1|nr:pantoate--beta-alanine ligase [Ilumatobacter sp.]MDJ0767484.1 pantoate--beta-alanine ligase [Ilumatobacter sp.]